MSASEQTPKALFKADPCRSKRTTKHEKGTKLELPRRKGAVQMKLIDNERKRLQTLSSRRMGLFKKGYELNKLTGKFVKVQVGEDFWCSAEEPTEADHAGPSSSPERSHCVPENNPILSPRNLTVVEVTDVKDASTQCNLLEAINSMDAANSSQQCRHCGGLFHEDSSAKKNLWVGCDFADCEYWIHAECLLGKSPKLTPKFVKSMPFTCHMHR